MVIDDHTLISAQVGLDFVVVDVLRTVLPPRADGLGFEAIVRVQKYDIAILHLALCAIEPPCPGFFASIPIRFVVCEQRVVEGSIASQYVGLLDGYNISFFPP